MHQTHRRPQGLGKIDVGAGQNDGAGAAREMLRRLAQKIGYLGPFKLRSEAVEQVQGRQART